jgi:hypothetical protein
MVARLTQPGGVQKGLEQIDAGQFIAEEGLDTRVARLSGEDSVVLGVSPDPEP